MTAKPPTATKPPPEAPEPLPLGILVGMIGLSAAVLLSTIIWATVRLWPEKSYDTSTPEAVIATAGQMLADRRADRLVELLEPVPPDEHGTDREQRMKDLYIRLGRVLAAAQDLHSSIERAMPEELEKLARDIEAAEARGEATSLMAAIMPERRPRRGQPPPESSARREARERAFAQILADPFGRLNRTVTDNIDRVGIAEIGFDTVAVTFDDRPVLPPFGLTMRQHPEGWRVVPPTTLPMIRRFMPTSETEFQIWGSLLATVEALLDDLRRGVESGRIGDMQALSRRAIEDSIIPIGMVMVALGRAGD
ncbi:MAG: hypothetical protein LAT64_02275 [Phycisphaerales bacterium]|nr:hypothetical protein [Planctomycetota bacterium]MCH8507585.1 hypothetical protein [Phycisphaerales bacterium]